MNKAFITIKNTVLNFNAFILSYIIFCSINMMTVINIMPITRIFLVFFGIWGIILCAYAYLCKHLFFNKSMILLIILLIVCGVSNLINYNYGGFTSLGKLFFFGLSILLVYAQGDNTYEKQVNLFKKVAITLSVVISLALFVSVIMYVCQYSKSLVLRTGVTAYLGLYENRLNGIFSSSNVGGMYAFISLFLLIYMVVCLERKNVIIITGYVLQYLIAMAYISAALSRGTYVSIFVFWSAFVLLYMVKTNSIGKMIALKCGVFIIGIVICLVTVFALKKVLIFGMESYINFNKSNQDSIIDIEKNEEEIPNTESDVSSELIEQAKESDANEESLSQTTVQTEESASNDDMTLQTAEQEDTTQKNNTEETQNNIDRNTEAEQILENIKLGFDGRVESLQGKADITNKRKDIWVGNLSLLSDKRNLFIGVNDPYVYLARNIESGKEFSHYQTVWIEWARGNMHNGYIQVLVNCGVVAFLLFIAYIILSMKKAICFMLVNIKKKSQMNKEEHERYIYFVVCVAFICAVLVNNIFESNMLLYGTNFFQNMFWFVAGTFYCIVEKPKEKNIN